MEGFKGTPGPWVNVGGWVDSDKPGDLSSIICAIDSVTPRNPEAVNDANANLIAAAPELLEALQLFAGEEIMAQLNGSEFVEPTDDEEWVRFRFVAKDFRKAAAAIKKALSQ